MLKRLGGFLGIPILSAVAPFIVLPIVSRIAGASAWGFISAGQAIGVLGLVIVSFGWGIFGPAAVAQIADERARQELYRDSLVVRTIVLGIATPIIVIVTTLIASREHALDASLMALAGAAAGVLPSWYCIGVGKPGLLARYDVIPRLGATVLAIPLMLITHQIWYFPVLTIMAVVAATWSFTRRVMRGHNSAGEPRRPLRRKFRLTLAAAGVDSTGNAYASTPVPIAAAALSPVDASSFGSADRAYRIGLSVVVVALGNAFQNWVLDPKAPDLHRRNVIAIAVHAVTGAAGLLLLWLLGPWATGVFFGADVAAGRATAAWFGVAFFFVSVSTPLIRNLLIPAGQGRWLLVATAVSAVLGLGVMLVGAARTDGTLVAAGLALSEGVMVAMLLPAALRRLASYRTGTISAR